MSNSSTWKKLLHADLASEQFVSSVTSKAFFLTQNEPVSLVRELRATLNAFSLPVSPNERHAQCQFPARFMWLNKQLDFSRMGIKPVECIEFKSWSKYEDIESISLVFATGYLGNPASYYGHTLIKLNTTSSKSGELLDLSINFGADVPNDEDPVSYIVKGLVGGYDSSFSHLNYYYHTHNYIENELRDLWDYQLNLKKDDVIFLLAHIWELLGQDFTYYFLNENCVSRMYELFSIIEGVELESLNPAWVIPQEVIKKVNKGTYHKQSLVSEVKYTPSRQANLNQRFKQLTPQLKKVAINISHDIENLDVINTEEFTYIEKIRLLDVLLDYFRFLEASDKSEARNIKKHYNRVLAMRYQLPPGDALFKQSTPNSPHLGRHSSYTQVFGIDNDVLGSGLGIKFRPAYYDQLDASYGHVDNALLKMAELAFEVFDSSLNIRSFTLVDLVSVKNYATGLAGDSYDAWKLKLSMEKRDLSCIRNCLKGIFQAHKGWSVPVQDNTQVGFYLGGAITENTKNLGHSYLSLSSSVAYTFSDNWNLLFDWSYIKYIENKMLEKVTTKFETRYEIKKNENTFDLRLAVAKDEALEFHLGIGYYW